MSMMMNGLTSTKTDVILLCNIHKFKHRWASPLCQHTMSYGWGKGEKSLCWLEPAAVHEHTTEKRRVREMGKIDKLEMQRKTHCQCARWWWEQVAASSSAQRTLGCSGWVWLTNSILLFEGLWPLPQLNFFRRISSASHSGILHFANWTRVKWEKNLNIDRRRWRGKKMCVYEDSLSTHNYVLFRLFQWCRCRSYDFDLSMNKHNLIYVCDGASPRVHNLIK